MAEKILKDNALYENIIEFIENRSVQIGFRADVKMWRTDRVPNMRESIQDGLPFFRQCSGYIGLHIHDSYEKNRQQAEHQYHLYEGLLSEDTETDFPEPNYGAPDIHLPDGSRGFNLSIHNRAYFRIVRDVLDQQGLRPKRIAEIGGGYGGLAELFFLNEDVSYYSLIDIPEMIFLQRRYLGLNEKIKKNHILFGMDEPGSHGITYIISGDERGEKRTFDVILNTSSFQEMSRESVTSYLDWAENRLSQNGCLISLNSSHAYASLGDKNVQFLSDMYGSARAIKYIAPNIHMPRNYSVSRHHIAVISPEGRGVPGHCLDIIDTALFLGILDGLAVDDLSRLLVDEPLLDKLAAGMKSILGLGRPFAEKQGGPLEEELFEKLGRLYLGKPVEAEDLESLPGGRAACWKTDYAFGRQLLSLLERARVHSQTELYPLIMKESRQVENKVQLAFFRNQAEAIMRTPPTAPSSKYRKDLTAYIVRNFARV